MIKYISAKTLAEMLEVSVLTIYGWTSMKRIPFVKIGRIVRFRPEEIEEWLKDKKIPAKDFN